MLKEAKVNLFLGSLVSNFRQESYYGDFAVCFGTAYRSYIRKMEVESGADCFALRIRIFASWVATKLLPPDPFYPWRPAEKAAWRLQAPLCSLLSGLPRVMQMGQEEIWLLSASNLHSRQVLKPMCAKPSSTDSHTRQCFVLMNRHFSLGMGSTRRFPARFNQGCLKAIQNTGQERK